MNEDDNCLVSVYLSLSDTLEIHLKVIFVSGITQTFISKNYDTLRL